MTSTRSLLFALLLSLFLTGAAFSEDGRIIDIRKKYNTIEGSNLSSKVLKSGDEATPVKVTRYTKSGQTMKIVAEFSGDHGTRTEYYYYWDSQLFFAFVVDEWWQFTGQKNSNGESETIEGLRETRLYFQNEVCIRSLRKELTHKDPKWLKKQIGKTENKSFSDPKETYATLKQGKSLLTIFTNAALNQYLK